jgi:uncharacterized membrane protein (UPF0127 family)
VLWVAATAKQQEQGLMGVTDLDGADGMVFRFSSPVQDTFYMFHTPMPLSIAWFGADGMFVSSADMAPCGAAHGDSCPVYGPSGPYTDAIEVPIGSLGRLGVGNGSRLTVGGT